MVLDRKMFKFLRSRLRRSQYIYQFTFGWNPCRNRKPILAAYLLRYSFRVPLALSWRYIGIFRDVPWKSLSFPLASRLTQTTFALDRGTAEIVQRVDFLACLNHVCRYTRKYAFVSARFWQVLDSLHFERCFGENRCLKEAKLVYLLFYQVCQQFDAPDAENDSETRFVQVKTKLPNSFRFSSHRGSK